MVWKWHILAYNVDVSVWGYVLWICIQSEHTMFSMLLQTTKAFSSIALQFRNYCMYKKGKQSVFKSVDKSLKRCILHKTFSIL